MSNASTKNFAVFVARAEVISIALQIDFRVPILGQAVLLNPYWRRFETEIIEHYRSIDGELPYVHLDGLVLKRTQSGKSR